MKKVKYSTAALQNPMRPDEDKKFYAVLQTTGTITTDELIEHISEHGSNFSEGTIAGVLRDIVSCVQDGERLLTGSMNQSLDAGAVSCWNCCFSFSSKRGCVCARSFCCAGSAFRS